MRATGACQKCGQRSVGYFIPPLHQAFTPVFDGLWGGGERSEPGVEVPLWMSLVIAPTPPPRRLRRRPPHKGEGGEESYSGSG